MNEMGKAMMGTGEASGDDRAMAAAEAAIANPLLDETSMRGAKGVLITITGGRDLTLFEVDEAATRIRDEVDPDANIILGATFDEELDGVIRVSVVATGIDKTAAEIAAAPLAIRQPVRKPATDAPSAPLPRAGRSGCPAPKCVSAIRSPKRSGWPRSTPPSLAPQAGRRRSDEFRPHSKLFQAPPAQPLQQPAAAPIAQQAREVQQRRCRACRGSRISRRSSRRKSKPRPGAPPNQEERGPMGLLKRLTNGLSRREDEPAKLQPAQPREPKLRQPAPGGSPSRAAGPAALRAAARPARRPRPPGAAAARRAGRGPVGDSGVFATPGELTASTLACNLDGQPLKSVCPFSLNTINFRRLANVKRLWARYTG